MSQTEFGKRILRLDTIPSTQEFLKKLFKEGAEEGVIAVASKQTLGRGRMNRSWDSPAGKGLWMSVLLIPEGPESMWGWVPLWAGAVARRAIMNTATPEASAPDLKLKWPNDLYWQGSKLGGILAEVVRNNGRKAVVLGFGINLLQAELDFSSNLRKHAVSIYQMTGKTFDLDELLKEFIQALNDMALMVKPIDTESIRKLWLESAWALEENLKIVCSKVIHEGKFVGLGKYGEIGLLTEDFNIEYIAATDDIQKLYHP
jgi:BirA family biotin operon repressor/biotin-[acetyl-CoA-carboxylase] ligase